MTRFPFILLLILLLAAAGCERHDAELEARVHEAYLLADAHPDSALAILDSLAPRALTAPRASRARHALATVKAHDKAFITHTSDTTILPLIDYYSRRSASDTLRPVALYYAGRVYADMGDAPRALDYLQQALDALPANQNPRLRSTIHAQMGGLLHSQGFFKESNEEQIKSLYYSRLLNDTLSIIEDLVQLAGNYIHLEELDSAFNYYQIALELDSNSGNALKGSLLSQIAWIYQERGQYLKSDSIINIVLKNPLRIEHKSSIYSIALDNATHLNQPVIAHKYIKWLIDSGSIYSKRMAYRELAYLEKNNPSTLPDIWEKFMIYDDSIKTMEVAEAVARMKSTYDYSLREKENFNLTLRQIRLQRTLYIVILMMVAAFFFGVKKTFDYRKNLKRLRDICNEGRHQIQLDNTTITSLKENITSLNARHTQALNEFNERNLLLNEELNETKEILKNIQSNSIFFQTQLLSNDIVREIIKKSEKENPALNSKDFHNLEKAIMQCSPQFYATFGNHPVISKTEWHVIMLLKIGLSTSAIASILYKSSSTISSIKSRLHKKMTGKDSSSAKDLDNLIDSL